MKSSAPSDAARAKAGFVLKGTTLRQWCRSAGVDTGYATKALTGKQSGPKARELSARILRASGAVDAA